MSKHTQFSSLIVLIYATFDNKWRAQFQKAITPLFVKIELLVPMCSVTPLVSWNQTIFTKKTLCFNNRYFWYTFTVWFLSKIVSFLFQKALTPIKLNIFVPKGNNSTKNWMIKDLLQLNVIFLIFSNRWVFSHSHRT